MSGGFFRGTSADQDTRFSNKQAKLLKSQKFPSELDHLVDITKVKMDVMKPWIAQRVTELLGFEDEVLINFIYGLLDGKEVNGKEVQISLTGFMEKNTGKFMKELWQLLLSAQNNASGVPQQLLDAKEEETRKKQAESDRIKIEMQKKKEKEGRETEEEKMKKLDGEPGMKEPSSKRYLDVSDDKEISAKNGARGRSRVSRSPHSPGDVSLSPGNRRTRSLSKSFSDSRSYSEERRKSRGISRSPPSRGRSISSEGEHYSRPGRSISPRRKYSPPRSISPSVRRSPHFKWRSASPSRWTSPSPLRRRMRSPLTYRSRSPIRRRSRTPARRRSRSRPRYRSRSPVRCRYPSSPHRRSPSPVRRRYRRYPSTPPPKSRSPIRRRSPFHYRRRSRTPSRYRSRSREALSSPSPAPRLSPSRNRKRSPKRQRSPVRSPRERTRTFEKYYPARHVRSRGSDESSDEIREGPGSVVHRPSLSLRSPQRDSRVLGDTRRKPESSSPLPQRSPIELKSPQDFRRSRPSEDKRSYSPFKSPVLQSKEQKVRDIRTSPPLNPRDKQPRHDSPQPITKKGELDLVRDNGSQKLKPSEKSDMSSKSGTHKDLERADGKTRDRFDGLELKNKELESRSEKTSEKVLHPEDSDRGKVPMIYKDTLKADEKIRPHAHETKRSNHHLEMDKLNTEVEEKDRSGSLSSESDDSYKRRSHKIHGSRKHRRSVKKEAISDDSSDSEIEDRKEAKRRKKEEKRLRKEERRRRREERHRKREERRAEKLKAKSNDCKAAEETVSDQKRLEIELREKALESLRAKKGVGH